MISRYYALFVSIALIALGIINLWLPELFTPVIQGLLHIFGGIAGIVLVLKKAEFDYIRWLSIGGLVLSGLAIFGFKNIFGLFLFEPYISAIYLIIGLTSLWFYMSLRARYI